MEGNIVLSVCIVNFNTRDLLARCLHSVLAQNAEVPLEVIVVDNGSSDGSVDMVRGQFPEVNLICNCENRYFAPANNQALGKCRGRYVLLLNSDTGVLPHSLWAMTDFLDRRPDAGACGGRFVNENGEPLLHPPSSWPERKLGTFLHSYQPWASLSLKPRAYVATKPNQRDLGGCVVEVISDAFLAVRFAALHQIGFYDEKMLLYFTEDDLARRLRNGGWKLYCCPEARVIHAWQQTSRQEKTMKIKRIHRSDALRFWRKHHGCMAWLLVYVASSLDLTVTAAREFLRNFRACPAQGDVDASLGGSKLPSR